jgi:hypothetical protein
MNSVDLFSGIGGIAWALRGIARPQLYCEIDPACQLILKRNMKKGRLPAARICDDVRALRSDSKDGQGLDLLTAGFPCVGFSRFGQQEGFDNAQSSLYAHVVRLARAWKPRYVFLENVPPILTMGMSDIVRTFVEDLGYALRWCVVGGTDVGARHERRRWFCLAVRGGGGGGDSSGPSPSPRRTTGYSTYKPMDWSREPVPRMTLDLDPSDMGRCRALGNAVIPDAVRYAFLYLWAGGVKPGPDLAWRPAAAAAAGPAAPILAEASEPIAAADVKTWPKDGIAYRNPMSGSDIGIAYRNPMSGSDIGIAYRNPMSGSDIGIAFRDPAAAAKAAALVQPLRDTPRTAVGLRGHGRKTHPGLTWTPLVFSPHVFTPPDPTKVSAKRSTALIKAPVTKLLWCTPRYCNVTISTVLTERCLKDLPTQVRFEVNTPDALRGGRLNPAFVEWLMGYPTGWTEHPGLGRRYSKAAAAAPRPAAI